MKKIILYLSIFLFPIVVIGQIDQMEKQTIEGIRASIDSAKSLIPVSKQSLLRDVDVIFNTRIGFDTHFTDGNHDISKYTVNQFRLEIRGKIHEKVSFRFRDRYTRQQLPGNLDNISRTVDMAFIKVDLSKRTQFTVGKMCADWGGYEFDFNPIEIVAYNDIIEYADNFLVGAGVSHSFKDNKNSLSFQLLNSRTKTLDEQYGTSVPPDIEESKMPLAFIVNWRSKFFKGLLETTYSFSVFNEAKGANMSYFALGNKFQPSKKFVLYYDFHYSSEELDRKGIVSDIISSQYQYAAKDALYIENWVRAEYAATPKVTLLLSAFTSEHSWKGNTDSDPMTKLSSSYGMIPSIEYQPFKEINMRFFVAYVARKYDYTSFAENRFGTKDYTTGQLSFGVVAPFLVL